MNKLKIPATKIKVDFNKIEIEIPSHLQFYATHLFIELEKKHNNYASVEIKPPFRPRSTGENSQNHRLNGFIMQICNETGNSYRAIKTYVYEMALAQGYPFETIRGKMYAKSEAEASVEECGILIACVEQLAAELGIMLIE